MVVELYGVQNFAYKARRFFMHTVPHTYNACDVYTYTSAGYLFPATGCGVFYMLYIPLIEGLDGYFRPVVQWKSAPYDVSSVTLC